MGFLGLIPAQQLKAVYYVNAHTLLLQASGDAQNYTAGIAFSARPDAGGELVFALMGWVGPLGHGYTPYEHGQRFDKIDLRGGAIMIEDANHPGGVRVPVEIIVGALAADAARATPQDRVQILLDTKLDLAAPAAVPLEGSVTIAADPAYLSLQAASIQRPGSAPEIAWSFKGMKVGETQVTITTSGGIAKFITMRTITVSIVPIAAK